MSAETRRIAVDVDYLARVEGESALRVEIDGETVAELRVFEPPRFFEGFLVGRRYDEVGDIVSRICGICPVSHMTTAILAIEKAMGIEANEQTGRLRDIMTWSQIAASHLVHLYALAMPDYFGRPGIGELALLRGEAVHRMIRLKTALNELTGLIGGRALHPVTHLPGGFTHVPEPRRIAEMREKLLARRDDAAGVVRDVAGLELPDFASDSIHVALAAERGYALNGGRVVSTGGLDIPVDAYSECFLESQVDRAYTKPSRLRDEARPFMVGALARMNVGFDRLSGPTRRSAGEAGFAVPGRNPFRNLLAQALEVHEAVERCLELLDGPEFRDDPIAVEVRPGEAGWATEAPRGLLYHRYAVNRLGIVEAANIVTPTSHNYLSLEADLKGLARANAGRPREELTLLCEMLVRAYDPCFSCSVH